MIFRVKIDPYKIEVKITSLTEMPELTKCSHMPHLQYNLSPAKNFVGDVLDRSYDVIIFISKY